SDHRAAVLTAVKHDMGENTGPERLKLLPLLTALVRSERELPRGSTSELIEQLKTSASSRNPGAVEALCVVALGRFSERDARTEPALSAMQAATALQEIARNAKREQTAGRDTTRFGDRVVEIAMRTFGMMAPTETVASPTNSLLLNA